MSRLGFKIEAAPSGTRARAGRFRTLHNEVLTPLFMPVGTQASVRNQTFESLLDSGSQILLANTYHLMLRPGKDVFEKLGGIHKFMNWPKSVLTDSGGFQVFSLPGSRNITEEGAVFQSYVDGDMYMLSPETSIGMQRAIGSDIMMVMDVCIPSTSDHAAAKIAMEQTHRWAQRSLIARGDSPQSIFGIVQGACHADLRKESANFIAGLEHAGAGFDGLAIGGLAVGETKAEREDFTELVTGFLPPERPRYLMGVGTPLDLLEAVHRGVDMFDCIIPTKLSEQGVAFTSQGRVQLSRGIYKTDETPIDPACACPVCRRHSKAYLHHLTKTCEPLGTQILGLHNVHFYHSLMRDIRRSILENRFNELYRERRELLDARDVVHRETIPKVGRRHRRRPLRIGAFEMVEVSETLSSIRHIESGEVMHPNPDPMSEARGLYVEQSRVLERLEAGEDLVVWDVGLGAAFNAMALIEKLVPLKNATDALAKPPRGKLRLVSFERDMDALRLAICYPDRMPHIRHPGPHALIDTGRFEAENVEWTLLEGDFLQTFAQAPAPDLIFFDPFSGKVDSPLWQESVFRDIHKHIGDKACRLFNYTTSTLVRARLLAAGFWVARGEATPPKSETTIALTPAARGEYPLLGTDFLGRLERSGAFEGDEALRMASTQHPQFRA